MTRRLASSVLVLEAFVVFFAALVATRRTDLGQGRALALGGVAALVLLLLPALLRRPWGYAAGWLAQVALVVAGFLVPLMFLLGSVFAGLWLVALRMGRRIDGDRAAYADLL